MSSEAFDLPLFDENTFLWKEKKELIKRGFTLHFFKFTSLSIIHP
jgi:hypothetical protein